MALTDDDVREILRLIDESELDELRIETPEFKLHVVRARAFRTNSLPSAINTASYCVDARGRGRYSLPVVSLVSDRANFFDANRGIYVCGNAPGCNYAQSGDLWERPCHVEFFETNGTRAFAQNSGVRMLRRMRFLQTKPIHVMGVSSP